MNTEEQNLPRFRGHVVAALETENDALKNQLKQRDETIKQLKEALKEIIPLAIAQTMYLEGMDGWDLLNEKYKGSIKEARKLIDL